MPSSLTATRTAPASTVTSTRIRPPGLWGDAFTGGRHDGGLVPLDRLTGRFPVALLTRP